MTEWRAEPQIEGANCWMVVDQNNHIVIAPVDEPTARQLVADHGKAALCEELADALGKIADGSFPGAPVFALSGEWQTMFQTAQEIARAALTKAGRAPQ